MGITHQFFETCKLPEEFAPKMRELGDAYEGAIGGIDLGFSGLWSMSPYTILVQDAPETVGFILGANVEVTSPFEGEKMMYTSAAYLAPEYRNSAGKHKGVLRAALEFLVNTLESEGFDRLRIFPPEPFCGMLVTPAGHTHVLRPLYEILDARKSEKGKLVGTRFELQYLFNYEDFHAKLNAAMAKQ